MKYFKSFVVFLFVSISVFSQEKNLNKALIPQPVFDQHPEFVDLYWKAWELAFKHIKEQKGIIQSPYMDEAFWDETIWIWDTEFMVMFCKYSPKQFPGIESLNNFYQPMLDDKSSPLKIQHPDNPAFFAWVEADYFKFTNDKAHLSALMLKDKYLQKYYHLFDSLKPGMKFQFKHVGIALEKTPMGYKWGGVQSGMDNTPRGRGTYNKILWVDALAQQALSALNITRLAEMMGDKTLAKQFRKEYDAKKMLLNKYYWDKEDGFYYDIYEKDSTYCKVKTPTSYWAMLAEVPTKEQALKMLDKAKDPMVFGGEYPWPTVARSDKSFNAEYGDYWKGAIWAPTAYIATKALEKYGFYEVADENAFNLLRLWSDTYRTYKPATIWECYNPSKPEPCQRVRGDKKELVRPDFCGWSALVPISMFIENVLGFHEVNAGTRTVTWHLHQQGKHGIRNLQFGNIVTDIIANDKTVEVKSNAPYNLIVNNRKCRIKKGVTKITL
jgi:hypothetical protein